MTPEFSTILKAAMQLPPDDRQKLVNRLSLHTSRGTTAGAVEKLFGTIHSSDPDSANNNQIDADLASEYQASHDAEN